MASEQAAVGSSSPTPTPQVVGNAFVHQYYHILHQSPELVYRFYQDSSKLGRPDSQGVMSSITTMHAINEKILSMDYSEFRAEIQTVDAQDSLNGGVLLLVTGKLISKDNVKRGFTQSFFLAPQEKGYYVLNDVFRYVEEVGGMEGNTGVVKAETKTTDEEPLSPTSEDPASVPENLLNDQAVRLSEAVLERDDVYYNSNGEVPEFEEEIIHNEVVDEIQSKSEAATDSNSSSALEEHPKKSYASIVKVLKENASNSPNPLPSPVKPPAPTPEKQSIPAPAPVSAPEVPESSSNAAENSTLQDPEASDGYAIYLRGLPMDATAPQLEEEFKRFGPIKSGGVQVRSNRQQGFCFGFVRFELPNSVQSAIEASPITLGGRQVYVEEKRASSNSRVARGRFSSGRGSYRNDGGRGGRGLYGVGRGYGRGEFSNRAEFSGRGNRGGFVNRGAEEGYQKVEHVGNGGNRLNRSGGSSVNTSGKGVMQRVATPT